MQSQNYRCQPSSNKIYTNLEVLTTWLRFAAKLSKHWEVYLSYLELPKELKINSGVERESYCQSQPNLFCTSGPRFTQYFFTQVFLYVVNIPLFTHFLYTVSIYAVSFYVVLFNFHYWQLLFLKIKSLTRQCTKN